MPVWGIQNELRTIIMVTGTVKFFNGKSGSITPEAGGDDISVSGSEIQGPGDKVLTEGQRVSYEPVLDPISKTLVATKVTPI
ncbi:cold-shock protein [Pseudomonas salmasensis]